VEGITLRYRHAGLELGDIVLLWNAGDPSYMVADLGTGLERLRWVISRAAWLDLVHGRLAHVVDPDVLDALRTTVLLLGSGIAPTARGPGSAVRLGLSTAVREFHGYWALTTTDISPWAEVVCRMERSTR